MAQHLPRSLKHEYSLYVEREIEDYKDSVPRSVLLGIGDEAVAELAKQPQIELDELVLWDEVDRIIKRRLRIPTYQTWRRRRLKMLEQYRRPEHWGIAPDGPLVRAIQGASDTHVLVTGSTVESAALYFAAHGCEVTAVEQERDVVERVVWAAEAVGLAGRVHGCIADLVHWSPESPLDAVVCTPASFAGLTVGERERVISLLQGATTDGGVHLVQTIVAGQTAMTLDELEARYTGWAISVEPETASKTFLARKAVA